MDNLDGNKNLLEDVFTIITFDADGECRVFRKYQDEYSEIFTLESLKNKVQEELEIKGCKRAILVTIVAEEPLKGNIYRWNNYGKKEWSLVGTTVGFA